MIEGSGIPTLVIGTVFDILSQVTPPRAVFVDHPVGRTFGPPLDRQRHEAVLRQALGELPHFTAPGQIRDPHFHWAADGSRAWEDELRAEILHDR